MFANFSLLNTIIILVIVVALIALIVWGVKGWINLFRARKRQRDQGPQPDPPEG